MSLTYISPKKPGRVYVRRFDHDEARRRYVAGEKVAAMAREYGVSEGAVWQVVSPATRASVQRVHARIAAAGRCDDCGGPMNGLSHYRGSRRCRQCASIALATTAREGELQCATCKEWKPDDAFPSNRAEKYGRRGRHSQCRICQTTARREHRRRNRDADNAYQREYRRRKRTPLQKATSSICDDGSPIQPTAEEVGKPLGGAEESV